MKNIKNLILFIILFSFFSCCLTTEEERKFFKSLDLGSHVFNDHKILLSAYGNLCLVDKDTMSKKYINNSEGFMASLSNNNDKIVFLKNEEIIVNKKQRRRFFHEIWMIDIDGGNKKLFKKPASFCSMPVFSKDDDRIYYIRMNDPQLEDNINKQYWTFDVYYLNLDDESLIERRLTNIKSEYFHNLKLTMSNELMLQVEKSYQADNNIYMYNLDEHNLYSIDAIRPFKYGQNYFVFSNTMKELYSVNIIDDGFTINLYKINLETNQKIKLASYDNDKLALNVVNAEVSPDGKDILFYLRFSHDGSVFEKGYIESHAFLCNISSGSIKKIFFEE